MRVRSLKEVVYSFGMPDEYNFIADLDLGPGTYYHWSQKHWADADPKFAKEMAKWLQSEGVTNLNNVLILID